MFIRLFPRQRITLRAILAFSACLVLAACSQCEVDAVSRPADVFERLKWLLYWCVIPTAMLLGFLWELIRHGLQGGWLGKLAAFVFLMLLVLYNLIAIVIILVLQRC